MAKPKLTDAARAFVVQALACFDTPSVVMDAVRKEFGVAIARQTVEGYDPTKRAGAKLSDKWKALFDVTRKGFLEKATDVPIAHRSVRLRALQRMVEKAEEMKNLTLAAQLLEQAAKEVGDAFTNRRQLSGPGGGPIQTQVRTLNDFYASPQRGPTGSTDTQPST